MLGWNIGVYRSGNHTVTRALLADNDAVRAGLVAAAESRSERIAIWQTGLGGLDWIEDLVQSGQAIDLGGNGYPNRFAAPAQALLPSILRGPPVANEVWGSGPTDILLPHWEGKTVIDEAIAKRCEPGEWLLVEAWDES